MTLTSRVKARSVQIAMVGMAVIALGALPAFADTPYHGGRAPQQQVMQWDRDTGCDARAPQWDRGGRRDDTRVRDRTSCTGTTDSISTRTTGDRLGSRTVPGARAAPRSRHVRAASGGARR